MPQDIEESVADELPANPGGDVEMTDGAAAESTEATQGETIPEGSEKPAAEGEPANTRTSFVSYLVSPIVTLSIGSPEESQTLLTAHQALLEQSPYFAEICGTFADDGSVSTQSNLPPGEPGRQFEAGKGKESLLTLRKQQPRKIDLPEEDIDAVGSFLEFLYTGEYFPRKLPGQRVLEEDPTAPSVDDTGDQLLKHARVYTLAEKFGINTLKRLSSSKIHCVNSTARGEIAYTRYVYANTRPDDTKVRAPIASFWATRSHTLRAEVEDEFKTLCLEYPQFGYDVLSKCARGVGGVVGRCSSWGGNSTANDDSQRASWTTSSRGSATKRCTPPRAAAGRGRATAAELLEETPLQHLSGIWFRKVMPPKRMRGESLPISSLGSLLCGIYSCIVSMA